MTEAEKYTLGRLLIAIEAKDSQLRAAAKSQATLLTYGKLIMVTTELDEAIAEARELMEAKTAPPDVFYVIQPRHGAQDTKNGPFFSLDRACTEANASAFKHQLAATVVRNSVHVLRISPSGFRTRLED